MDNVNNTETKNVRRIPDRKSFKRCIENIKRQREYDEELNKVIRKYCEDGYISNPSSAYDVMDLLSLIFNEDIENSIITFFCDDLEFGAKYYDGVATDSNGKNIPLSSIDELYDYLIATLEN